ncbi:DUF4282 domain-containing protein [bacterium]|nr:DUF4282 domain-containing protein [bacterium]
MEPKNFLQSLFDFKFESFITKKVIPILYGIFLFFAVLASIGVVVSCFKESIIVGIFGLIGSPIVFLLLAIIYRVSCELILVLFSIEKNTRKK